MQIRDVLLLMLDRGVVQLPRGLLGHPQGGADLREGPALLPGLPDVQPPPAADPADQLRTGPDGVEHVDLRQLREGALGG